MVKNFRPSETSMLHFLAEKLGFGRLIQTGTWPYFISLSCFSFIMRFWGSDLAKFWFFQCTFSRGQGMMQNRQGYRSVAKRLRFGSISPYVHAIWLDLEIRGAGDGAESPGLSICGQTNQIWVDLAVVPRSTRSGRKRPRDLRLTPAGVVPTRARVAKPRQLL